MRNIQRLAGEPTRRQPQRMGRETEKQWRWRRDIRRAAAEIIAAPAQRCETLKAGKVVGLWNARIAREAEPLFVPTIAAALRAGRPWLEFQCRACGLIGEVDVGSIAIRVPRSTASFRRCRARAAPMPS